MTDFEKARRMEIRRDIGNRKTPVPEAPRMAPQYLIAHACFDCRKSFKVAPRQDYVAVCPSCGGKLHEMGRSFKAPLMRDIEQWAKVQVLYNAGFFSAAAATRRLRFQVGCRKLRPSFAIIWFIRFAWRHQALHRISQGDPPYRFGFTQYVHNLCVSVTSLEKP